MNVCENCRCQFPAGAGGKMNTQTICCVHCVFHPLGCRCRYQEWGQPETVFAELDYDSGDMHEFDMEPVGSCDDCGVNIYQDEDDGSGLCDQCQWYIRQANPDCRVE